MRGAALVGVTEVLPRGPESVPRLGLDPDPCDVFLRALHSTHEIPGHNCLPSLRAG